jgi:hypothetical protein
MSEIKTETRAEETTQRRRRREDMGANRNLKLHVPENAKDPNFEYRWANDRPGRVQQFHGEDWDRVEAKDGVDSNSPGTTVTRTADRFNGENAVLLRKPKKFHEEDRALKQKPVDATEKALRHGPPASAEGLSGQEAYVPGGKNIVGR